jgi:hypothetical protein
LDKLNVNPENCWDQSAARPPFTHLHEVADSPWFKDEVAEVIETPNIFPSDLLEPQEQEPQCLPFAIPFEQHQDATGDNNKESLSLEPVMIGSGLLQPQFNGDLRSRFIIGHIPSFTKTKATPGNTKKKFGATVSDHHKCMSILFEPLVKAQKDPPLLDVLLGVQVCRVCITVIMAIILGDGKSTDMLCGRVMLHSNTLRLSRATFAPSALAKETRSDLFNWTKSNVIEQVTRAALFDATCHEDTRSEWNTCLRETSRTTAAGQTKSISAAKWRLHVCAEILKKVLGSHAVLNAFFLLDLGSDHGVFGHTFADLMHVLEEDAFKHLLSMFLDPLSDTASGKLDSLVTKLFGSNANRCHGMHLFPRVNFTCGFTWLHLACSLVI